MELNRMEIETSRYIKAIAGNRLRLTITFNDNNYHSGRIDRCLKFFENRLFLYTYEVSREKGLSMIVSGMDLIPLEFLNSLQKGNFGTSYNTTRGSIHVYDFIPTGMIPDDRNCLYCEILLKGDEILKDSENPSVVAINNR